MAGQHKRSVARLIFLVAALAPILATLLIGGFMYARVYRILQHNARADLQRSMDSVLELAQDDMLSLSNTYYRIISSDALPAFDQPVSVPDARAYEESVYRLLFFDEAWTKGLLSSVSVYGQGHSTPTVNLAKDAFDREREQIAADLLQSAGETLDAEPFFRLALSSRGMIYAARSFYDWRTAQYSADVVLGASARQMSARYSGMLGADEASVCLFDASGRIYMHTDPVRIGQTLDTPLGAPGQRGIIQLFTKDGERYLSLVRDFPKFALSCMIYIPESALMSGLNATMREFGLIALGLGVVFVLLGMLIGQWFRRQVLLLCEKLNHIRHGDYSARMPDNRYDEISLLSHTYNRMASQIQQLIRERYERQLLLKQAQIEALQSQMNPHFLFNVLMTIAWKARLVGEDVIYQMVNSLSELLRASLYTQNGDKITVREELVYVDYYLMLQKQRYQDRIQSEIHIEDERIWDCLIPKLTLQPIVENAVRHGLEGVLDGGCVTVSAAVRGADIVFTIADNGAGFDVCQLRFGEAQTVREDGPISIGLQNTHRRIVLIYGEQYGLNIESRSGQGTNVTITIPLEQR